MKIGERWCSWLGTTSRIGCLPSDARPPACSIMYAMGAHSYNRRSWGEKGRWAKPMTRWTTLPAQGEKIRANAWTSRADTSTPVAVARTNWITRSRSCERKKKGKGEITLGSCAFMRIYQKHAFEVMRTKGKTHSRTCGENGNTRLKSRKKNEKHALSFTHALRVARMRANKHAHGVMVRIQKGHNTTTRRMEVNKSTNMPSQKEMNLQHYTCEPANLCQATSWPSEQQAVRPQTLCRFTIIRYRYEDTKDQSQCQTTHERRGKEWLYEVWGWPCRWGCPCFLGTWRSHHTQVSCGGLTPWSPRNGHGKGICHPTIPTSKVTWNGYEHRKNGELKRGREFGKEWTQCLGGPSWSPSRAKQTREISPS